MDNGRVRDWIIGIDVSAICRRELGKKDEERREGNGRIDVENWTGKSKQMDGRMTTGGRRTKSQWTGTCENN